MDATDRHEINIELCTYGLGMLNSGFGLLRVVTIGRAVADMWHFFDFFSKMAAVRHLGYSSDTYWTTREEYLVVFIVVQNEHGWIRCSFDNTIVIACAFGLNTPINASK